ncbi:carbohydrate ABC transporter permease [Cohnella soli]|uniref:Carbohydrate ABC transporter permease n=1 Tax=Cohnella soli TaxID=425005 RepID=A0ABW0HNP4_9BACL
MSRSIRLFGSNAIYYAIYAFIVVIVLVPIFLVLFGALKTPDELAGTSPLALPGNLFNMDNFVNAYKEARLLTGLRNTFTLTSVTIVFNAVLGTMTAYVLNRFRFKLRTPIFLMFMAAMIIPSYTTEIARFQIIHTLGFYDKLMGPLLIYIGTDIMQIYIYMQFLEKISTELDESAMLDGASYVRTFRSIIFPLLLPATATLAILKAVTIMNDIYTPYLYLPSKNLATLSTSLMTFVGERGSDWTLLCAGIVLVLLPNIIVYSVFQRYIFKGLMDGAVKG